MEHLLQKSKCPIFHNIFRYMILQRCQKALLCGKWLNLHNIQKTVGHHFEQLFGLRKSETCIYVSQYMIIISDHVLGAKKTFFSSISNSNLCRYGLKGSFSTLAKAKMAKT